MTQKQSSEERLENLIERIGEQVESIAGFVGRSAELQMATQHKLDQFNESIANVGQKLDQMAETAQAQDAKWDRRLDILTTSIQDLSRSIQQQDQAWERRIQDVSQSIQQQDQAWDRRIDRLVVAVEGQQQTTQELIKLVTILAEKVA